MTAILDVDGISGGYGGLLAVDRVSLTITAGARHAIIGANGAGKSTLLDLIAGTVPARSGRVLLAGSDISRWSEHARARAGLTRTSQQPSLFLSLSVLDNVALAAQRAAGVGLRMLRSAGRYRRVNRAAMDQVVAAGLYSRRNDPAGALSHGERRQLDVAMALATNPRVLLLDEPAAGLSAVSIAQLAKLLMSLAPEVTVVIVEHDIDLVFGLATHITVLHQGAVLADGPPHAIRRNAQVQQSYLGDGVEESLFF